MTSCGPLADEAAERALRAAASRAAATIDDMLAIVAIPAPSFEEGERADWLAARWRRAGLGEAARDAVGNVIVRCGTGSRPLVVAAHLDTVFPRGTPLTVRRSDGLIEAPGIADNARGLAVMIAVAESLAEAALTTRHPVLFVGTVGEEGAGDLRGVKHLFRADGELRDAHAFIALDGSGLRRIVHRGVGSRRLRITVRGPGGHSWADRGTPNALHAVGGAIARIGRSELPGTVPSALTVARAGGGISINAIPGEAWFEVDARSESPGVIDRLVAAVHGAVHEALEENDATTLTHEVTVIGDRPAGATAADHPLVAAAATATRQVGGEIELVASSTDANVPMACGVPAIAVGGGGESGGMHTPAEWYRDDGGRAGVVRALALVLLAAGVS